MRIVSINLSNAGSTGNIMKNIGKTAESHGHTVLNLFPQQDNVKRLDYSDWIIKKRNALKINSFLERITGLNDSLSVFTTIKAVRKIRSFNPDLIHLHNLHGSYLNIWILFRYLADSGVPVVWTLHDCWSFTGRCPHFEITKCGQWINGCRHCIYPKAEYPRALVDTTRVMYRNKKKSITRIKNLTIVTPSQWLANLVKQSFLGEYPIRTINNGIDLNVFKPTVSNFRKTVDISENTYLVLGVSFSWGIRKGLDVFLRLAEDLPSNYRIILVGTDEAIEKVLPENIISIHSTNNQSELAEIYSAADVFVNPTREDNFPTVNIEALACGTPVVTFSTGGSPEIIDERTGISTLENDYSSFIKAIIDICEKKEYLPSDCTDRAEQKYDMLQRFEEYVELYEEIVK